MILSHIITFNYKSCKEASLKIISEKPNVIIGMNDCGKTTFMQAIEKLLSPKSKMDYPSDESAKSDLTHTPLSNKEINDKLEKYSLPPLKFNEKDDHTVIAANFIVEKIDHIFTDETATMHLKWLVHSSIENNSNSLWIIKVFNQTTPNGTLFYLTYEGEDELCNLHELTQTKINSLVSKYDAKDKILNDNNAGPSSNFEKIRALYESTKTNALWSNADKNWKKDVEHFPTFRYLDWNQSIESLKIAAKDILANSISHEYESARKAANQHSTDAQKIVDNELNRLGLHDELDNINSIHANIFFKVDYQLSDIMIQKNDSEQRVHIDSQGEGVKRQLWFAFLKSQAEKGTENSKERFIWCFDEPETHLHPKAQRDFFKILKALSKRNFQILISTHSTIFVDSSKSTEIYSFHKKNNYTQIGKTQEVTDIHSSLGIRNSDFLFYNKFLIVEGKTEQALIPELYNLYTDSTLEEDNTQLIALDGCKNRDLAEDMLSKLMSGYSKVSDTSIYLLDHDAKFSRSKQEDNITFLVGRQDIEDAIRPTVWCELSNSIFGDIIDISESEIIDLVNRIPNDREISKEQKFAKTYRSLIVRKLQEQNQSLEIKRLPQKGFEWGKMIAEHIHKKEHIPEKICLAFDLVRH